MTARDEIVCPEDWEWTTGWAVDLNRAVDEDGYILFLFIVLFSFILLSRYVSSLSSSLPFFLMIRLPGFEQARIIVLRLFLLFNSLLSCGQTARHREERGCKSVPGYLPHPGSVAIVLVTSRY